MIVTKSWADRWNDIQRDVLFPDEELKQLMMIPDGTNIVTWIRKYFVSEALCTELVTDEDVRVLWYEDQSSHTNNPLINNRKMCFDIYVKQAHNNDATNDLFVSRGKLIAQKLQEILTFPATVGRVKFFYVDDYDVGTKMVGYVRHHLVVSYLAGHA